MTQACAQKQGSTATIKTLETAADFSAKIEADSSPIIIDVRTEGEFNSGHLKGAANIDFYSDKFVANCMQYDTLKPVYVYCKSGGRSATATKKLEAAGFKEIYELKDGIMGWNAANLPVTKE